MGRQIRFPLMMSYSINERMCYNKISSNLEKANFLMKNSHNIKTRDLYTRPCKSNKVKRQRYKDGRINVKGHKG